ncbi:Hydroxyneurosporene desaturase [Roseovarius gaetbuli]|uniref:Hydroxyneurosporene desaturase n=1 Tax=Roseovarius gaetbuli TaxID=1356575 RepID=A0A1X6ZQ02_9RHOB|nr:Hydroxyneurosporene desaturase [Roseovarius gaetbuli]
MTAGSRPIAFCSTAIRALASGLLGPAATTVARQTLKAERSLSAQVWAFAAKSAGVDLVHHNVFFCAGPKAEFDDLHAGRPPRAPTIYLCAQDRGLPDAPPERERFEIILNAPPLCGLSHPSEEFAPCQTRTFLTLARFGLRFDPLPEAFALTTPGRFERLFPASLGSLYGQSPHAMMAAFQRPTARTPIAGLYLAGSGAHPGAGVPMATLSARHAAEAILSDRTLTSTCPQTAMPGGTSTA